MLRPPANDTLFYIKTVNAINTSTTNRWALGKANNAEAGSNLGSYFILNRYDDAGIKSGQPMMVIVKIVSGYLICIMK